jgi:hypothetical protein
MESFSLERCQLIMASMRGLFMTPLLVAFAATSAESSPIDQLETFVLQPDRIIFQGWNNLPDDSGEMAKLYGDFEKHGPYLVMMKWHPGCV